VVYTTEKAEKYRSHALPGELGIVESTSRMSSVSVTAHSILESAETLTGCPLLAQSGHPLSSGLLMLPDRLAPVPSAFADLRSVPTMVQTREL
jgi:hypothetical protein